MQNLIKGVAVAGLLTLAALPSGAAAQTTVNGSSTITIPTVLYISATNPHVVFPTPAASDFDAGFIDATTSSVLTHKANVAHSVTVKALESTMTATGGKSGSNAARAAKPSSDLLWSADGKAFQGLTTTAQAVRGAAGPGSYSDLQVDYRMALRYEDDTPGTYGLNFVYTIVAD